MKDILLVDDDSSYQILFRRWLVRKGLTVDCASDGNEALLLLAHQSYRLLITDCEMPGMDGLQLAARVAISSPDTPVVMLTSNTADDLPLLAQKAGIKEVIIKSFDPIIILSNIIEAYNRYKS